MNKNELMQFCKEAEAAGVDIRSVLKKCAAYSNSVNPAIRNMLARLSGVVAPALKTLQANGSGSAIPAAGTGTVQRVSTPAVKTPSAPQFSNALPVKPPQLATPAVPSPAPLYGKAAEAYWDGFAKMAEECGVDPRKLLQKEAEGRVLVQALLRMILPKAQALRRLISRNASVNRTPMSMLTRAGREATLRDTGESASFLARILPKDSPAYARDMREASDIQLLRQMNGNKRALTDTVAKQLDAQQTPGKAYNLINALVGRKLQAPK